MWRWLEPFLWRGTAEVLLYAPPDGYANNTLVSLEPRNTARYGLDLSLELRYRRAVAYLMPHVLFGEEAGRTASLYDGRPTAMAMTHGIGLALTDAFQLRLSHGQWYTLSGEEVHGSPWNSVSIRYERPAAGADQRASLQLAEIHYFPPHNEYDPSPTADFNDRVVARYALDVQGTVTLTRAVFAFARPFVLLGDARPQISYSHAARPLASRVVYGVGARLPRNLELRLSRGEWHDLGGYRDDRRLWTGASILARW